MKNKKQKKGIEPNVIDRVIGYFSPEAGRDRYKARVQMSLASSYYGGSKSRSATRNWMPGSGSANADTAYDLPEMRSRSRDLVRNTMPAGGAINTMVTHVIGTGLSLQPSIDFEGLKISEEAAREWQADVKRRFVMWAKSTDCDMARTQNFYGLQKLAFRSFLESGDVFALLPSVSDRSTGNSFAVQLIEADRVCNPGYAADTETMSGGVEFDPYNGAPQRYWIANRHPGDMFRSNIKWYGYAVFGSDTGRRNVLHMFDQLRPGQARGVPILSSVIEPIKQLGDFTAAELSAAVIAGSFAVFTHMDHEAFQDLFEDGDTKDAYLNNAMKWDGTIESGKATNLLPGESVDSFNPDRPNSGFDPFFIAIMRQVGMLIEVPVEVLMMHYQSSYSASRAALLQLWRMVRVRRDWKARVFCQPIYEDWLADEISMGRIEAPGFFSDPLRMHMWSSAEWIGDGPGSIDPVKDVTAAEKRVSLGISTLDTESIAYDGTDYETKHRQQVRERGMRKRDGLPLSESGSQAMATVGGAVVADQPDEPASDLEKDVKGESTDE